MEILADKTSCRKALKMAEIGKGAKLQHNIPDVGKVMIKKWRILKKERN